MNRSQKKTGFSARVFAWIFLPVFAVAVLLPSLPVPVWTARDAAIQALSAIAFAWMLWNGWREGRRSPAGVFTLDILDVLLLGILGWFVISAGDSKQPFESSTALRGAFSTILWWFILRATWRRWPGLFPVFVRSLLGISLAAALWIIAQTVQARWVASAAFFTGTNLWSAAAGAALLAAGAVWRRKPAGTFLLLAGVLAVSVALTVGLQLEQREGPFPNVNIAAGFLGAVLLVAVPGAVKGGWGIRSLSTVLFLAWAVTQSRGAFFSMLVVVAAILISHMRSIEDRLSSWSRSRWWTAALTGWVALVSLLPMITRFFNALNLDPRAYWRWFVWESSVKMALQAPLLGYGPGTFGEVYPYFRNGAFWEVQNPFAHCEYLQVAAECGWPALIGILLLLFVAGTNLARRAKDSFEAERTFWILLLIAVHSAVDFTFHEWSVRLLVLAFAAYALREKVAGEMDLALHFSPRSFGLSAALLGSLVLLQAGWFSARDYYARTYYYRGLKLQNSGHRDDAEKLLFKSLSFRPDFMGPWNSLGALELDRSGRVRSRADALRHERRAREHFERAMSVAAYSLAPRENFVKFLEQTGSLSEALSFQRGLTAGMPAYPPHHVREARILMRLGRSREALPLLEGALKIDAYHLPARVLRVEALERLGDKRGALKEYETIRSILKELNVKDDDGIVERNIRRLGGR